MSFISWFFFHLKNVIKSNQNQIKQKGKCIFHHSSKLKLSSHTSFEYLGCVASINIIYSWLLSMSGLVLFWGNSLQAGSPVKAAKWLPRAPDLQLHPREPAVTKASVFSFHQQKSSEFIY